MSYNPNRTPLIIKNYVLTLNTSNNPYYTPTTGKTFRLLRLWINVTNDVTQTTAGNVILSVKDETTTLIQHSFAVPASGGTITPGASFHAYDFGSEGLLFAAANDTLRMQLNNTINSGRVIVTIAGTEQ